MSSVPRLLQMTLELSHNPDVQACGSFNHFEVEIPLSQLYSHLIGSTLTYHCLGIERLVHSAETD